MNVPSNPTSDLRCEPTRPPSAGLPGSRRPPSLWSPATLPVPAMTTVQPEALR
jgi:hypothetical protein